MTETNEPERSIGLDFEYCETNCCGHITIYTPEKGQKLTRDDLLAALEGFASVLLEHGRPPYREAEETPPPGEGSPNSNLH